VKFGSARKLIFFFIPQFWICKETHLLHCSIWIYKDMFIFFFIPQFWICKETHLLHCSIWIYKDMFIFFIAQSTSARMMFTFFIPQSGSARMLIFFICIIRICKDSHLHLHCPIWICKDHVHLLWLLTFMQILRDRGSVCCAEDAHPLHLSIWIC